MFSKIFTIAILLTLSFSAFGQSLSHSEGEEYTAEQKAKLNQAEELAGRFVQRWHETLDWKILFDEFFVKNADYWKQNFGKPTEEGKAALNFEIYFLMNSQFFLEREIRLVYGVDENFKCIYPSRFLDQQKIIEKELEKEFGKEFNDMWDGKDIDALTETEKNSLAIRLRELSSKSIKPYQDVLPTAIFSFDSYKFRLDEEYPITEMTKSKLCNSGYPIELGEGIQCYSVRGGVFDFYIIEEDEQMRVLWVHLGR